jgi:ribonuclease HII
MALAVAATASPRARRPSRSKGRKLFIHDRKFGVRFVAGADEAGRGCLAGRSSPPRCLFASRPVPRDGALARQLKRLKAAERGGARGALPDRDAGGHEVSVVSRCPRGIDTRGCTAETRRRCAVAVPRGGPVGAVPERRLRAGKDFPQPAGADRRRRHEERAIAGGVDVAKVTRDRAYAAPARTTSPAWGSTRTSATRRPSTATRSAGSASRRCTACRSSRWPTSSWRSSPRAFGRSSTRLSSRTAPDTARDRP